VTVLVIEGAAPPEVHAVMAITAAHSAASSERRRVGIWRFPRLVLSAQAVVLTRPPVCQEPQGRFQSP
jgi:hypothetical protein